MTPHRSTPLEASLGFRLDRLVRALRSVWAGELAPLDLTPPQAAVLRGVAAAPGTSVRALARLLGGDPMNVKRCVDELERRGLVTSEADPGDRRPRLLSLTGPGGRAAAAVAKAVAAQEAWLTGSFVPGERAGLEATLTKLESEVGLGADTSCDPGEEPGAHQGRRAPSTRGGAGGPADRRPHPTGRRSAPHPRQEER